MVRRHTMIGLGLRKMHFRSPGLARMLLKGKGSVVNRYANLLPDSASTFVKSNTPNPIKSIKPLSFRY